MTVKEQLARVKARFKLSPFEKCGCRKPDVMKVMLGLAEKEQADWGPKMNALREAGVFVGMSDWPDPFPDGPNAGEVLMATTNSGDPIWNPFMYMPIDVAGDSHISEFGPTAPDQGIAERVASYLKCALMRSCALGGAVHAYHNQGNGAQGDGGWAHIAQEFNRQEQSSSVYNSTITQTQAAGVSSYTVTSTTNGAAPKAGDYLVIGQGAATEIVQITQAWAGTSPITFIHPTVNAHTTNDPIYHACRNEGYLAKSAAVILCAEGGNDLGLVGPGAPPSPLSGLWQSGTFGTTIGASVGLGPLMHSLRFTIAQLRCSVIYAPPHSAVVLGANWTNNAANSTASYPVGITPFQPRGFNAGNYYTSSVAGSTVTFSTAPDFPGGTVNAFCYVGSAGQGAVWDYSVSGATTIAMTTHASGSVYDTRGQTPTVMNNNAVAGATTGTVVRITGLAAGVNTVTLKATTIGTLAGFLGFGIEPPAPALPAIFPVCTSRAAGTIDATGILAGPGVQYNRRALGTITGGTVAGGTPSTVTFVGGTFALATAGTPNRTLGQINDTITVDKGNANEETRRITGYTGSPATSCAVDAPFTSTHTNAPIQIGLQDADYVGGGYVNQNDTQGAISVPGLQGVIQSVGSEFDNYVQVVPLDPFVNGGPGSQFVDSTMFYDDGIHYNDKGSGAIASGLGQVMLKFPWSFAQQAAMAVTNKRTFQGVYNDAGATPAASTSVVGFVNSWTNVYSTTFASATSYPRTHFYRNVRTKEVWLEGAVRGGVVGSIIFTLPPGYRPGGIITLPAWSITSANAWSAAAVTVDSTGAVKCTANPPVTTTGAMVFGGNFLATG